MATVVLRVSESGMATVALRASESGMPSVALRASAAATAACPRVPTGGAHAPPMPIVAVAGPVAATKS